MQSLKDIATQLIQIGAAQDEADQTLRFALGGEADAGKTIHESAAETIRILRNENATLHNDLESLAANACAVVMTDSGYTDEDRRAAIERSESINPGHPRNPMILALTAAVAMMYGDEGQVAKVLRAHGWIASTGGVVTSWRHDKFTGGQLRSGAEAIKMQCRAELNAFVWLIDPQRKQTKC